MACQLAAVEALLKGGAAAPPCGVRLVVGATPPPGSLSGNDALEVADRLADFLRAHPSVTGLPDLVVVRRGCRGVSEDAGWGGGGGVRSSRTSSRGPTPR